MFENRNKNTVLFQIHVYFQVRNVHHEVFRRRVGAIRHSIDKVSEVNKDAKFKTKAETDSDDFIAYLHRTILIKEFRGNCANVIYLDSKDITICYEPGVTRK